MRRTLVAVICAIAAACQQFTPHRPPDAPLPRLKSDLAATANVSVIASDPPLAEGAVAISPLDQRIVIAAAIETATQSPVVRVFQSSDGAHTWSASTPLPMTIGGRTLDGSWDPVLAFDRNGVAYLCAVGSLSANNWTLVVYRSTDNGATWAGVDVTPSIARIDKPWIAIDNSGGPYDGSIYVAYYAFVSGSEYRISRSRDGGQTWTTAVSMQSFGWPFVATSADGSVYASFIASTNQSESYAVMRSGDGGATWSTPSMIAPLRPGGGDIPRTTAHQIAASRNAVYAIIPGPGVGSALSSVYLSKSLDGGATWSALVPMSSENADASLGSITIDPITDEFVMTWIDRRDDPNKKLARVFASHTIDAAAVESPAPITPPFSVSGFIGDYNQLAAQNGKRVAVFADASATFASATFDSQAAPPPPVRPKRRAIRR